MGELNERCKVAATMKWVEMKERRGKFVAYELRTSSLWIIHVIGLERKLDRRVRSMLLYYS